MKKLRKILSLALVLVMLCSMMNLSAFASADDPEVTVYITRNMFTEGGYSEVKKEPVLQEYIGGLPSASNYFNSVLGMHTVKISDISSMSSYYGSPSSIPNTPNVLDAILHVLTTTKTADTTDAEETTYAPVGGWDSYTVPNGGYISYFSPEGGTTYNDATSVTKNNVVYDVYTGTGWQIACTQSGTVKECSNYGTSYSLSDGMVIVFDLSAYSIYYPNQDA